jgi:hypothetical protein
MRRNDTTVTQHSCVDLLLSSANVFSLILSLICHDWRWNLEWFTDQVADQNRHTFSLSCSSFNPRDIKRVA